MSLSSKIHLRQNEEILGIMRRYSFTLFWRYLLGLAIMFAVSFFMFWLFARGWWGWTIYGLGMFTGVFYIFTTWFFSRKNIMIATSERVVDITRLGWFDEIISSVGYSDIKDIFLRKKGILAGIFDYGSVFIETRSKQTMLEAVKVKSPQKCLDIIAEAADAFYHARRPLNRQVIYSEFLKLISGLSEKEACEIKSLLEDRRQIPVSIEKDEK